MNKDFDAGLIGAATLKQIYDIMILISLFLQKFGGIDMAIDLLNKEAEGLSEEQMSKVVEYIKFLKYTLKQEKSDSQDGEKRSPGGLTGKFYMSEDFDETPDCFKEYM